MTVKSDISNVQMSIVSMSKFVLLLLSKENSIGSMESSLVVNSLGSMAASISWIKNILLTMGDSLVKFASTSDSLVELA